MWPGEKYEKLDVGSFTVAKCNDAFTAGPHDDNWNTKQIHVNVIANTDLNFANILLLHNSQFELTLACQFVFCTQHSVHMTQEVLTGWNVNVCIGVKNPMKSSHFWSDTF